MYYKKYIIAGILSNKNILINGWPLAWAKVHVYCVAWLYLKTAAATVMGSIPTRLKKT